MNLNILVLHRMGDPKNRREAVRTLEYMIPEHLGSERHNCFVHDASLPLPSYLKDVEYHLIVLGPTFLCFRHFPKQLGEILEKLDFIKDSPACKIALPQDEYDSSEILDNWMFDWNIDIIYSVCYEQRASFYLKAAQTCQILPGYTTYVPDSWIDRWKNPKKHELRNIDVSYRTHNGDVNRCYLRTLKYEIADRFKNAAMVAKPSLALDISNKIADLIPGIMWHDFLADSKFCLATPSGSSLIDPQTVFRRRVESFMRENPSASYDEVESSCFSNLDKKGYYTAISPRNVEAALAETIQIATPGAYSGMMEPGIHYISLDENCANVDVVIKQMEDRTLVDKIRKEAKESILSEPRLRQKVFVEEIMNETAKIISQRKISGNSFHQVKALRERHKAEPKVCPPS